MREKVLFFSTRIYTSSVGLGFLWPPCTGFWNFSEKGVYKVQREIFWKIRYNVRKGALPYNARCFHISEREIIFGDYRVMKASYFSRYSRSAKISEASRFARGCWVTKFSMAFLVLGWPRFHRPFALLGELGWLSFLRTLALLDKLMSFILRYKLHSYEIWPFFRGVRPRLTSNDLEISPFVIWLYSFLFSHFLTVKFYWHFIQATLCGKWLETI